MQSLAGDGKDTRGSWPGARPRSRRRMRLFARHPAVVDELVQDVFVDAYFSLSRYRGDGEFPLGCRGSRLEWVTRLEKKDAEARN